MKEEGISSEKKEVKKKKKSLLSKFLGGDILTEKFVIKQSKLIILIVFLILLSISNYYDCAKKLTEMQDLNNQLKNLKYENLIISTELTTNSRQSQIEELLKQKGILIEGSKSPMYEIHK